ncbi:MAG TPA: helix-turn-helix domain-containing protein [Desulfosporosinus sp.]|nr:helix-turn-helix domain-containing protein [Desulfosporosinus sp.]
MENSIAAKYEIEHPKKRAFLAAYAECGTITRAAEIAGIERGTHYEWVKKDLLYAKATEAAYEQAGERLEQEARRRAVEGTQKPVWYQGEQCGVTTEYSDTLLIFLLKGAKPEKYQERIRNDVNVIPPTPGGVNTLKQLKEAEGNNEDV